MARDEGIFLSNKHPQSMRRQGMMTEFRDTPQMIIMADDDPEDCLLTQEAWEESGNTQQIRFVHDGEELLDYLHHRGKFASAQG